MAKDGRRKWSPTARRSIAEPSDCRFRGQWKKRMHVETICIAFGRRIHTFSVGLCGGDSSRTGPTLPATDIALAAQTVDDRRHATAVIIILLCSSRHVQRSDSDRPYWSSGYLRAASTVISVVPSCGLSNFETSSSANQCPSRVAQ
ncbi:hypothetical protein JTB14_022143 [Gonioctena quinquepunctata]|nr:hypothetical protein JTB14_022143 [Gonioctena quinquepunctata]